MFLMYLSADIDIGKEKEKKIMASCEAGALLDNCYGRDCINAWLARYGLPVYPNPSR